MAFRERTVTGYVIDADGSPVQSGVVSFQLDQPLGYTSTHIVINRVFTATTDSLGAFSVTLWCEEDSLLALNYSVNFPIANSGQPQTTHAAKISLAYQDGSTKNIGTLIAESQPPPSTVPQATWAALIDERIGLPAVITGKPAVAAALADLLLISDDSDSGNLKKATVQSLIDLSGGGGAGYTDEQAQDAVGVMFDDTATIDVTYTDLTPELKFDVKPDSISNTLLADMTAATIKGRITAGTGDPENLSGANVRSIINVADGATANASDAALRDRATHTGTMTLEENAAVALDPALSADGKYTGITRTGTAGAALAFGNLAYLDPTDSRWELCDANSAAGADGDSRGILGMCILAAAADGDATNILLIGTIRADAAFPAMTINNPMYVSETAGAITGTQPTTTDAVIRIVGRALTADELYFNPSQDYITHV